MSNEPSQSIQMPVQVIIADAGDGTRCIPFTKDQPKGRLPLGGLDSTVEVIAKEAVQAGLEPIVVVRPCDYDAQDSYFNDVNDELRQKLIHSHKDEQLQRLDSIPSVTVVPQDATLPYGNAAPVLAAMPHLTPGHPVIVCYGDDITIGTSDIQTLVDSYRQHPDAAAIIMGQEISRYNVSKFGMIAMKPGSSNLLDHIVEKPKIGQEPSLLASYGRYLLTDTVLETLRHLERGKDGEIWTVDAITQAAQHHPVYVERTKGEWHTTGNERSYQLAFCEAVLNDAAQRGDTDLLENVMASASRYLYEMQM